MNNILNANDAKKLYDYYNKVMEPYNLNNKRVKILDEIYSKAATGHTHLMLNDDLTLEDSNFFENLGYKITAPHFASNSYCRGVISWK